MIIAAAAAPAARVAMNAAALHLPRRQRQHPLRPPHHEPRPRHRTEPRSVASRRRDITMRHARRRPLPSPRQVAGDHDVMLNQVDISANKNKFYLAQVSLMREQVPGCL